MTNEEILCRLLALAEEKNADFQSRLTPTVPREAFLGIRTPALRKLAKEIYKSGEYADFLISLPHRYFDENNLHGFLISEMRDYECCMEALGQFLPYVNNWATCDQMRPVCFKKHLPELLPEIRNWLASDHPYTVRFGIEMLMTYYLEDAFRPEQAEAVAAVRSEEYYVNMMIAWYFATALAKQYDAAIPYLEKRLLPEWVHRKTIQKSCESFRISPERKDYLRSLK